MIDTIRFVDVLPDIFVGSFFDESTNIWRCVQTFEKGRSYLIEAASGKGKSSFCAFACGLRKDYQGKIDYLDGSGCAIEPSVDNMCLLRKKSLAVMFQNLSLFPELTAVENVLLKNRITDYFTEQEIRSMMLSLGLSGRLDTPCAKLSLGQQQRVAFVRTLSQPADFIILDEPVSHLDYDNAIVMGQILAQRQKKDGVGIIVTSIGNRLPYDYDVVLHI